MKRPFERLRLSDFAAIGAAIAVVLAIPPVVQAVDAQTPIPKSSTPQASTVRNLKSAQTTELDLLASISVPSRENLGSTRWNERLYSPTTVTNINGLWFIVDCWHHRILSSNDLSLPISQWRVVDKDLAGPHSIAYGNGVYAVDNTDAREVIFYKEINGAFVRTSKIKLGQRPHRVYFDSKANSFYILSSMSQQMHRIGFSKGVPRLVSTVELPFLEGSYTRSFTIIGDEMLFVSGSGKVVRTTFRGDSYRVLADYSVPEEFRSMNDIHYTGSFYILTATPQAIGLVKNLEDIPNIRNQASELGIRGTPYYVSQYGKTVIIPEVTEFSSVQAFRLTGKGLSSLTGLHAFGVPISDSLTVKASMPK